MRLAMYRRRAGRGVRGLGIVSYPSGYGEWLNPNWNDRFRGLVGLGQDPYQQWVQSLPAICWQGGDPSSKVIIGNAAPECMTPASVLQATAAMPMHQPSPENFVNPTVAATANNPTFITATVSDAPTLTALTANLEGHLAQAVTNAMADTTTLSQVGDPTAYLQGFADQYCALYVGTGTQCPNSAALVAQYAAELQNAINQHASAVSKEIASYGQTPGPATAYSYPTGYSTNPAATKTNAVASSTPARRTNPASQTTYPGNALNTVTYSGSVATGTPTTTLNPYNNVNVLGSSTTANTQSGGGPLSTGGDTSWIWIVAIGAGVVLLMMNQGAKK